MLWHAGTTGAAGSANLASLLGCLARAPKLPALDWGTLCQTLLRLHTPLQQPLQPASNPLQPAQSVLAVQSSSTVAAAASGQQALQSTSQSDGQAADSLSDDDVEVNGSCQLEATALEMAVRHGADPSLGLDAFLRSMVLDDARLGRLARAAPEALQQLAQQLPQVVAILPEATGPAALRSIIAACSGNHFIP